MVAIFITISLQPCPQILSSYCIYSSNGPISNYVTSNRYMWHSVFRKATKMQRIQSVQEFSWFCSIHPSQLRGRRLHLHCNGLDRFHHYNTSFLTIASLDAGISVRNCNSKNKLQLNNHPTVTTYYNYVAFLYIKRGWCSPTSSGRGTKQELKAFVIQSAATNDQVLYLQHI